METEKPSDLFFLFWSLGPSSLVPAWGPSLSFSGKLDSPLSRQGGEGVSPDTLKTVQDRVSSVHYGVLIQVWKLRFTGGY